MPGTVLSAGGYKMGNYTDGYCLHENGWDYHLGKE